MLTVQKPSLLYPRVDSAVQIQGRREFDEENLQLLCIMWYEDSGHFSALSEGRAPVERSFAG